MRVRKRWVGSVVIGVVVLVFSTVILMLVGTRESEKAHVLSEPLVVSGNAKAASPIEDYRQARYLDAIRGLTYESGFVELDTNAQEVLGEGHAGEDVDALLERGAEQLEHNMVIEALETYTLAALVDPTAASAYEGLGRAFVTKGKTENAIASFRTTLRVDPILTEARYRLGAAYWMQGDFQEAVDTWQEVVDLDSNHARTHERLAIALYYMSDYQGSWQHVHAAEALGYEVPPQFRPLLEAQMAEP